MCDNCEEKNICTIFIVKKTVDKREMMNVYIDTSRRRKKKNHCGLSMDNGYRGDLTGPGRDDHSGKGEMEGRK